MERLKSHISQDCIPVTIILAESTEELDLRNSLRIADGIGLDIKRRAAVGVLTETDRRIPWAYTKTHLGDDDLEVIVIVLPYNRSTENGPKLRCVPLQFVRCSQPIYRGYLPGVTLQECCIQEDIFFRRDLGSSSDTLEYCGIKKLKSRLGRLFVLRVSEAIDARARYLEQERELNLDVLPGLRNKDGEADGNGVNFDGNKSDSEVISADGSAASSPSNVSSRGCKPAGGPSHMEQGLISHISPSSSPSALATLTTPISPGITRVSLNYESTGEAPLAQPKVL
ncbi:hypothetical protein TWF730_010122 [Orbilia blumenaviensis]|uniref:Uncharacterized protein n=1 Tax=Orbilia blumenaviensis TaxID=1796055 RepID=A0AAV9V0C5_9PEZI